MSDKKCVFVSISNQKGGIGKSTVTMLVASLMHVYTDLRVAVVDVDPQGTISKKRQREIAYLKSENVDGVFAKTFEALMRNGKKLFDIFAFDLNPVEGNAMQQQLKKSEVHGRIAQFRDKNEYDIVFFDFAGFTDNAEIMKVMLLMDYHIVPFYADENSVHSTLDHISDLESAKAGVKSATNHVKDFAVFLFRFSTNKFRGEWDMITESMAKRGIRLFENKVYDAKDFETERSTIVPFDMKGDKSLRPLIEEIIDFTGLRKSN